MPYLPNVGETNSQVYIPSAYRIDGIFLEGHNGFKQLDIRNLVTDFSITESIYTPTVTLSMNVKDSANLLEEMKVSGQERITVSMSRKDPTGNDVKVAHSFIVTEYPVYGRFDNRTQVYNIRGISPHAFLSRLKKISRAKKDSIRTIIEEILRKDLHVQENRIVRQEGNSTGMIDVVIPYMHPLDAVNWLVRRALDESGSPFFFYETFGAQEGLKLESLSRMFSRPSHRTFKDAKFFDQKFQSAEDYQQRLERIISIASDLNLSKFAAASAGAYASNTQYLDLHNKTLSIEEFNYLGKFGSMMTTRDGGNKLSPTVSESFVLADGRKLTEYYGAHTNHIPVDPSVQNSYNSIAQDSSINLAQSYVENLDSIVHDLEVEGDFDLHPGKTVELEIPRAIDPNQKTQNSDVSTGRLDTLLSGKYLVTSVVHKFSEQYYCSIRVKKDYFPEGYFKQQVPAVPPLALNLRSISTSGFA